MTATDELRRLLDERGVEYETYVEQPTGFEHVKWNFSKHGSADFNVEFGSPWLTMYGVISGPEQAVEATLGRRDYTYEQWREISDALGDAMEYAHDRAIECPDKADPLWNLDEYVNRVLNVAFGSEATLGRGTCHISGGECDQCGAYVRDDAVTYWMPTGEGIRTAEKHEARFCPSCGRRVVGVDE